MSTGFVITVARRTREGTEVRMGVYIPYEERAEIPAEVDKLVNKCNNSVEFYDWRARGERVGTASYTPAKKYETPDTTYDGIRLRLVCEECRHRDKGTDACRFNSAMHASAEQPMCGSAKKHLAYFISEEYIRAKTLEQAEEIRRGKEFICEMCIFYSVSAINQNEYCCRTGDLTKRSSVCASALQNAQDYARALKK